MKEKIICYFKNLNWKFLFILVFFCFIMAIINNLRIEDSKSVEWIGSQPVMEKPE